MANPVFGSNTCAQCQALLEVLKFVSLAAPERGPDLVVVLCGTLKLSSTCEATFGRQGSGLGAVITQVVANADIGGYDGQVGDQHFPGDSLVHCFAGPMSKFFPLVLRPSDLSPELDGMVHQAETKPTTTTKTSQRQEAQSAPRFRLTSRPKFVSIIPYVRYGI